MSIVAHTYSVRKKQGTSGHSFYKYLIRLHAHFFLLLLSPIQNGCTWQCGKETEIGSNREWTKNDPTEWKFSEGKHTNNTIALKKVERNWSEAGRVEKKQSGNFLQFRKRWISEQHLSLPIEVGEGAKGLQRK